MRLVLILIALLALSVGEARADVFVPADPPTLRSAQCSAGAGDVVAAGTAAGKLRVSVGGGGWHELVGLSGCPVVAAAADGTLAIANVDNSGSDVAAAGLVIRGPGGAFRPPVVVGEDPSDVPSVAVAPGGWVAASSDAGEDVQRDVQAVVASGGRAAVAWSTVPDEETQVFGLTGQLGGAWGAPTRLSSITRTAWGFNLALDAAGVPRAVWSEAGLGVRGASLAPAWLDVSPPTVTARLPSRVAPTVDGNVAVTVRVRCTEACDARLAFAGGEHDRGHVVRALEPGRTAALRLRASDALQYELIVNRRSRRLRLQVLVTDRAGNLVRRSVTLRVRVLEPPIRTFKVAPGRKFGMDTPTGNRAVARFVNDMIETIARGGVSSPTLARRYTRGLEAIARKLGPDYAYSDEVRSAIYDALWLPLARTHNDVGWVLSG